MNLFCTRFNTVWRDIVSVDIVLQKRNKTSGLDNDATQWKKWIHYKMDNSQTYLLTPRCGTCECAWWMRACADNIILPSACVIYSEHNVMYRAQELGVKLVRSENGMQMPSISSLWPLLSFILSTWGAEMGRTASVSANLSLLLVINKRATRNASLMHSNRHEKCWCRFPRFLRMGIMQKWIWKWPHRRAEGRLLKSFG